jgi:hypothetical protein
MPAQLEELRELLLQSPKFLAWQPSRPALHKERDRTSVPYGRGEAFNYAGKKYTNLVIDEKHFSPTELATAWGVSAETIRVLFRKEPGVLRVGANGLKEKRSYVSLRIPRSVAERVHKRLSAVSL